MTTGSEDDLPIMDARGFGAVDAQPDPSALVAGMEATAQWPAVIQLRAWEQDRLALRPGDALLDVGCGIGDVARSCATLVGPEGRVVGIDTSEAMLAVARATRRGRRARRHVPRRRRARDRRARCVVRRVTRRARAAVAPDMVAGAREMLRTLRPGGRCCLTDTDWRTFAIDLPDPALSRRVADAMVDFRGAGAAGGCSTCAATWGSGTCSTPRRRTCGRPGTRNRCYMSVSMTSVFGRTPSSRDGIA